MDSGASLSTALNSIRRDDKFYFPDGNVTLLVSDTLFRVHKHVVARDGSTFEDMFSLSVDVGMGMDRSGDYMGMDGEMDKEMDKQGPRPGAASVEAEGGEERGDIFVQDGWDDAHPIVMQGDSEDEFRDLLWALYALPQEIAEAMSPRSQAAVIKLSNVALVAHKYHFASTELWALRALHAFFQIDLPNAVSLSTSSLVKVTEVAVLCGSGENSSLIDALRTKWKVLIRNRKDLGLAISVTERLGIRDLCGLAYHSMLLQGRETWDKDPSLTREHRIRLLSGYHAITQFSDTLPSTPPPFTHHPNCVDGPEHCNRAWKAFWGSMMSLDPEVGVGSQAIRHEKLDVMGRMMMAVSIMRTLEEGALHTTGGHPFEECDECHRPALDATVRFSRKVQDELVHFFPDVV